VGEQFGDRWEINELVEKHLIDYARVTLPNVGGITEFMKIAALCETHYVGLVPHFTGPVALAALVHVLSALPVPALMEIAGTGAQAARPPACRMHLQGRQAVAAGAPRLRGGVRPGTGNPGGRNNGTRRAYPDLPATGWVLYELVKRDAFKQILLIALDNALKHSSGEIAVTARRAGDRVEIQVVDHGEGIPSEKLAHIFDRFYRGEESSTIPGFGLGLPIARALVEAQGGEIEMQSEPGVGSVLTLCLARAREKERSVYFRSQVAKSMLSRSVSGAGLVREKSTQNTFSIVL
jgi:signal transduction histidine kinase